MGYPARLDGEGVTMSTKSSRVERDSMGAMEVPADAYYGASTQRALLNFPISSLRIPPRMIHALGWIKWAAAGTNQELELLEPRLAQAIEDAALEVAQGRLDAEFPLDVFQTGS